MTTGKDQGDEAGADLFGGEATTPADSPAPTVPAAPGHGGARPGAGRPKGAVAHVSRELRTYLVAVTGRDAIVEHYRIASLPIMSNEAVLERLAQHFRCTREKAFDIWHREASLVFPHVYPKLGQIEIKPPGTPGAEDPFGWLGPDPVEGEGRVIDITDLPFDDFGAGDFGAGDFGAGDEAVDDEAVDDEAAV